MLLIMIENILSPLRPWCESTFQQVCDLLLLDFPLSSDAPGGMPEYRCSLVTSFFYKFFLTVLHQLKNEALPCEVVSATQSFKRSAVQSSQGFQKVYHQSSNSSVGRPMMHLSALQQATGEARYVHGLVYTCM